jgi:MFS family permease
VCADTFYKSYRSILIEILIPPHSTAISQVTNPEDRTRLMAWYNLVGCFSSAVGAIFCGGIVAYLSGTVGISILLADRIVMILYSCVKVSLEDKNGINILEFLFTFFFHMLNILHAEYFKSFYFKTSSLKYERLHTHFKAI